MKKLVNYFNMAALAAAVCLSSCTKDETEPTPAPTVQLVPGDANVTEPGGTKYTIVANYHADEKISQISVFKKVDNDKSDFVPVLTKEFNSSTDHSVTYQVDVPVTGSVVYEFQIMDKNNKTASKSITVSAEATASPINSYSAVLMGANKNTTLGSFFSTSDGMVLKLADAKSKSNMVDFLYYYGANNQATLAAPSDPDANKMFVMEWTTENATILSKTSITAADFDGAMSGEQIAEKAVANLDGTTATNLKTGDVVAFKTSGNKVGLIKVTKITTGDTGAITIDVKVQK